MTTHYPSSFRWHGRDLIVDPGSYLYTPCPAMRNAYRSAQAHDAPRVTNRSAADLTDVLFDLEPRANARLLALSGKGMAAELEGPDWRVLRAIVIEDGVVTISDASWGGQLAPLIEAEKSPKISIGYGKKIDRPARSV